MSSYDEDDDEYLVTNLDDGSKGTVAEVTKKLNIVKVSNTDAKYDASSKHGDDADYFDATQNSVSLNATGASASAGTYRPLSVPAGGRLMFTRISAVGVAQEDDKPYSVFYIEVQCNVASPNSWLVYRRYSQFQKLSVALRSEGYSVPILPSKKILGSSFTPEFIRQRRSDLERWLFGLADLHASQPGSKDPQGHPFYRSFLTEDANKPPLPLKKVFPEHIAEAQSKVDDDFGIDDGSKGGVKVREYCLYQVICFFSSVVFHINTCAPFLFYFTIKYL
jgi:hypothetical protein